MPKAASGVISGPFLRPGVTMPPDLIDPDARLTVAQAALHFKLSKAVINSWYARGHLKDVTHDAKGQRLYLMEELLEAERKTRRHPNSSRSAQRRQSFQLVAV